MIFPITPIRAWMVILTSNRTGRPCHYHMTESEIETCDRWLKDNGKPNRYAWLMEVCTGMSDTAKLEAIIMLAQDDLAHYMADNSEDGELWEDKFPELDGLRSWLQEFVS